MKLTSMVRNDLRVFARDYKSFILLFLAPLFITASIGVVYMNSTPHDVPMLMCSESAKDSVYLSLLDTMERSPMFNVTEISGDCTQRVAESIESAESRIGLVLRQGLSLSNSTYRRARIEVIYDNAAPINFFIQSYFSIMGQRMSNEVISSAVGMAHYEINSTIEEMDYYIGVIEKFTERTDAIRLKVLSVRATIGRVRESLDGVDQTLNDSANGIDSAISDIDTILAFGWGSEVSDPLESARSGLVGVREDLRTIANTTIGSARDSLLAAEYDINSAVARLDYIDNDLNESLDKMRVLKAYLQGKIEEVPSEYRQPVVTEMRGFFGNKSFINFLFPSIILIVLMWISTFLSSVAFIKQRNQGILRRIYVSPTGITTIILSKILVYTIISLLFLPFIVALGVFAFGVDLSLVNIVPIFMVYSLTSMLFVLLGLIIASFSGSENTAILASLMIVIPFMFLSGTLYPQESLPLYIKAVTDYLPTNIAVKLFNGFFFYSLSPSVIMAALEKLLEYLMVTLLIAWAVLLRGIKR